VTPLPNFPTLNDAGADHTAAADDATTAPQTRRRPSDAELARRVTLPPPPLSQRGSAAASSRALHIGSPMVQRRRCERRSSGERASADGGEAQGRGGDHHNRGVVAGE
jgi:hypothetical protein